MTVKRAKAKKKRTKDTRDRRPWLPCPVPKCGHPLSEVVRVMATVGRRQRRCLKCGELYLTVEKVCRVATGVNELIPALEDMIAAVKSVPPTA
jgi:hypothetical protein